MIFKISTDHRCSRVGEYSGVETTREEREKRGGIVGTIGVRLLRGCTHIFHRPVDTHQFRVYFLELIWCARCSLDASSSSSHP